MKISQTVSFGQVENIFVSSWNSENEIELRKGEDKVVFTMSEMVMKQFHKRLGEKLTNIAATRLKEAEELTQEQSDNE